MRRDGGALTRRRYGGDGDGRTAGGRNGPGEIAGDEPRVAGGGIAHRAIHHQVVKLSERLS